MISDGVLSKAEQLRVERTFDKLSKHDTSRWALTGGFATELHIRRLGGEPALRSLHDVDFIVSSFDCIPESLGRDFLIRHVHPPDPPGKTLLQCVDSETGVRVDVFRTQASVMERVSSISPQLQMISHQDLTARAGRLTWDMTGGKPVAPKHVRDFLRLLEVADFQEVEAVWKQHKNAQSPETFAMAAREVNELIASCSNLLVSPPYSQDVDAVCNRCERVEALRLADARLIVAILGYC
jgi:hypothetical protein